MRRGRAAIYSSKLFHLDVGGLDDGSPQREFVGEQLAKLVWRADLDVGAERGEPRARLRRREALAERYVELIDDGRGASRLAPLPQARTAR